MLICALSILALSPLVRQTTNTVAFADLDSTVCTDVYVRRRKTRDNRTFALGGKAFVQGFETTPTIEARIASIIPPGVVRFHADFGVSDQCGRRQDRPEGKEAHFELKVDGEVVRSGDLVDEATPIVVDVDLTGHRSVGLYLRNGAGIGDPVFFKGDGGTGKPKLRPVLVPPKSGTSVTGDTVRLRWQPVEGASAYGVSVVALKLASAAGSDQKRLWSFTVSNPSFDLPLNDLPEGDYVWNVIAFGPKEPLGTYSVERSFAVER